MSTEQVEEAAVAVTSELGHVKRLNEITGVFDKAEIGLILAMGVCKFHEYQCLKGNQEEKTSFHTDILKRNSEQIREH